MKDPLNNKKLKSDQMLNKIISTFITLKSDLCQTNNQLLRKLSDTFLCKLKSTEPDFAICSPHIKACGSYFKKTKIIEPDEYDLNIILNLPLIKNKCKFITNKNIPGYVQIDISEAKNSKWEQTSLEKKIVDSKTQCLDNKKFRQWFESIIDKSFRNFDLLKINDTMTIKLKKSGPAQTLKIFNQSRLIMSIDFVLSIEFSQNLPGYRSLQYNTWLAIPKEIKYETNSSINHILWRISFYELEDLILRKQGGNVNQVIRLLKKTSQKQGWSSILPSYFIETLFYNEIEDGKNFNNNSLTQIYVYMLTVLRDNLEKHEIKFFWNTKFNLLKYTSIVILNNLAGRIKTLLKYIQMNINNYDYTIMEILLTKEEILQITNFHDAPANNAKFLSFC